VLVGLVSAGCLHSNEQTHAWTIPQAETVTVIRGTPVTVRGCRGLGRGEAGRFERFACVAGARAPTDDADTVAILYELRPSGPYEGARSRYALTNVRFVGGPGVP
jgi:hypothetical protein